MANVATQLQQMNERYLFVSPKLTSAVPPAGWSIRAMDQLAQGPRFFVLRLYCAECDRGIGVEWPESEGPRDFREELRRALRECVKSGPWSPYLPNELPALPCHHLRALEGVR